MSHSRSQRRKVSRAVLFFLPKAFALLLTLLETSQAQNPVEPAATAATNATPSAPTQSSGAELSTHEEVTTFKVRVNEVLVRAVVRDQQGHAIGNLKKEDFELFDRGKPQTILHFAVEQPALRPNTAEASSRMSEPASTAKPLVAPSHFVIYLFDDLHGEFSDLYRIRVAAEKNLDSLTPADRAAIFTTSGQSNLDFTDDRVALHAALKKLTPMTRNTGTDCPSISYFMADLIYNHHDATALGLAVDETLVCAFNGDPTFSKPAIHLAEGKAAEVVSIGQQESRITLTVLKDAVRRLSAMPGQRTILLLSPGFIAPQLEYEFSEVIDHALRAQVVISALDIRGLYTLDDISKDTPLTGTVAAQERMFHAQESVEEEALLAELAEATGGQFFHNNNDLEAGLWQIGTTPKYWYVLGFSTQNLKLDGQFHKLKVVVKNPPKLTILTRKGYYAPKHPPDADEAAKQEIEDALFSQEEVHDLPIEVHTQFFKPSDKDANLAVLVHIDAKLLHFSKANGRNLNKLTIVSGLFDRNGRFISANEKTLDMHLKDETLANRLGSGITLKSDFDVKPGTYLVRLVLRDAEGQISAANDAIEIP